MGNVGRERDGVSQEGSLDLDAVRKTLPPPRQKEEVPLSLSFLPPHCQFPLPSLGIPFSDRFDKELLF